ncbi:hypothetical protein EDD18DRAFT_1009582, partial [Armillaria luteobubalina]
EAPQYYAGLPSSPVLLARTSIDPWRKPEDLEAWLSSDVNHKLNTDWEDNVALKVHACLDGLEVEWTSTDVVHIGEVGESSALWIGVIPKSLTGQVANIAAFGCFDVLIESGVTDVDVEI